MRCSMLEELQVLHPQFQLEAIRLGHVARHQSQLGIFLVHQPGIPEFLFLLSLLLNVLLLYNLPLTILIYGFPFHHALYSLDVVLEELMIWSIQVVHVEVVPSTHSTLTLYLGGPRAESLFFYHPRLEQI